MKNIIYWLVAITVSCFAIGMVVLTQTGAFRITMETRSIDETKTVALDTIDRIVINTASADINLKTSEDPNVIVHYSGSVRSNKAYIPDFVAERSGGEINIRTGRVTNPVFLVTKFEDFSLEVTIPRTFNGSLEIETASGNVKVADLVGKGLDIKTVSGDVETGAYVGRVVVETVSGDCLIGAVDGPLKVRTVSGDAEMRLQKLTSGIDLHSTSGSLGLKLPADSQFELQFKTVSGDLSSDFAMTHESNNRRAVKATVGDGRYAINAETTSGDVRLEKN